jgi:anti-sigma regulatory factor (Ser/Thr protein kinase)
VIETSFHLPPAKSSAPRAREALRVVLGTWADQEARDDAALLLTELVANGVIHARSAMEIRLTLEHDVLRAEVRDASPINPLLRDADELGGRGVLILDALASRWGVLEHLGAGKTVWFELGAPSRVGPALSLV